MRDKVFSKKEFIASVTENVKTMYRKTLKEATTAGDLSGCFTGCQGCCHG